MFANPKTSTIGYIMIAVVVVYMFHGFYTGKPLGMETVLAAIGGIAGIGFVMSKDGGR